MESGVDHVNYQILKNNPTQELIVMSKLLISTRLAIHMIDEL